MLSNRQGLSLPHTVSLAVLGIAATVNWATGCSSKMSNWRYSQRISEQAIERGEKVKAKLGKFLSQFGVDATLPGPEYYMAVRTLLSSQSATGLAHDFASSSPQVRERFLEELRPIPNVLRGLGLYEPMVLDVEKLAEGLNAVHYFRNSNSCTPDNLRNIRESVVSLARAIELVKNGLLQVDESSSTRYGI